VCRGTASPGQAHRKSLGNICPYTNRRFDPADQPNILKKGEKASTAKATSSKPASSKPHPATSQTASNMPDKQGREEQATASN